MSNPSGAVIRFGRVSDWLTATIPATAFVTTLTIEFRIDPCSFLAPATGLAYPIYLYQSQQAYLVFEYPFNGGTAVGFSDFGDVPVSLALNRWHSIRMTIARTTGTGANVTIVVDGGAPITAASTRHTPDTTTPWILSVGEFQGDLDEVRISKQ